MKRERGRDCFLEMQPPDCIPVSHTHTTVGKLLNIPQELKAEVVYCVPWIQILEPLSFLTKVLNAVLAEKFKSMLN